MALLMWNGLMFTQFVESVDPPVTEPGACFRRGDDYWFAVAEEDSIRYMAESCREMKATPREILNFIIDNSRLIPRKWRDRYMRMMVFCFHNALLGQ